MVLVGRPATSQPLMFDGFSYVVRFFFYFENVAARTKPDNEMALELLCYFDGSAANFFFETFAPDVTLSDDGKDYQKVKASLISHFKPIEAPQDIILRATSATLNQDDLLASLRELNRLYARAGFNDASKFGVLRNAVVRLPELAHFFAYRGALNYDTLHTAVKDYATSKVTYGQTAHSSFHATQQEYPLSPDQAMESKVDELADQLKDLTLITKGMRKAEKTVEVKQDDRVCSYCRKPGHAANRCESNPHRNKRCINCNKIGHSAATCWSANRENGQKAPATLPTTQSESQAEMRLQTKETPSPVSFVGVVDDEDVVATTKRTTEGEPLPKQPRSEDPQKSMSELTRTAVQAPSGPPSVPTIGNT